MAIPTSLSDLSTVASSNPPSGVTSIGAEGIDDHFRAGYAFTAQLNALKIGADSPAFTGTVTLPTSWKIGSTTVVATGIELNYVAGVTSALQAQLNAKAPLASPTFTTSVALPATWSIGGTTITATPAQINSLASAGTGGITDPELLALAAVASAADTVPYFTGSGAAAVTALTAAGRALLDDADAAAQRATLGLGTLATQSDSNVAITGGAFNGTVGLSNPREGAFTRASESLTTADGDSSFSINWDNGGSTSTYTGGAITASFANLPSSGRLYTHFVHVAKFNNVTWPAAVTWGVSGKPSIADAAIVSLVTIDGGTTVYAGIFWRAS